MKKQIVLAVLAVVSLTFAQEQKTLSFGVRAGLNMNSATLERSGNVTEPAMLLDNNIGFHVGVIADIAINQFLYLQPGLMFSTKGGIINFEENDDGYHYKNTSTTNVYCIELPLMLSFKAPLTGDLFLRTNIGPYFDFGISGTFEDEREYSSPYEENEKNTYSDDVYPSDNKRFNVGIGVGGGFEYSSFYLGLNYYYGFINVLDADGNLEAYDRTLGITLGYNF